SVRDLMTDKTPNLGERRSFGFRMKEPETFTGPLWPASSFGHTGFTGTSLAVSPRQRLIAIILTNRVYYGRNETTQKIADFRTRFHTLAFRDFC
ncbi:MAG: serine hydrolase, partial [Candidatus Hydrogenedentales bacterium]